MRDQNAVITGATSGIGNALAVKMANAGVGVAIVGRDADRLNSTDRAIAKAGGAVRAFRADLSSLADVHHLASQLIEALPRIDILIHCAGIFTRRRTVTADGFELMFATNYLSAFLLTDLLMARLMASAPARILVVTAPSTVKLDFDDLQGERHFSALRAFGASKAADLVFVLELARRLDGRGVTANGVHPGLVRTGLMREAPAPLRWVTRLASASPDRAASSIVPLALSPDYAGVNGRFFNAGREIAAPTYTRDPEVARRLWETSSEMVGKGPTTG